jgi:hypothetical protein
MNMDKQTSTSSMSRDRLVKKVVLRFGMAGPFLAAMFFLPAGTCNYWQAWAQLEDYLRGKVIGPEMERMCLAGNIMPQIWMKNAVGSEISVKPVLKAVDWIIQDGLPLEFPQFDRPSTGTGQHPCPAPPDSPHRVPGSQYNAN